METRKIIQFGRNSFVISLPKRWVTKNSLSKGNILYLKERNSSLVISKGEQENKRGAREIVITVDNKSIEEVKTEIVSAYLTNYNIIILKGENIGKQPVIYKEVFSLLPGIEIFEMTSQKLVANDILDELSVDVDNLIRRIDIIVKSMIQDVKLCLDEDKYCVIYDRDKDINRLVFLAYRVLRDALSDSSKSDTMKLSNLRILELWHIVMRLEKIGDQSKRIARHLRNMPHKEKLRKSMKELIERAEKRYYTVMKAFYSNDARKALSISVTTKSDIEAINKFCESNSIPPLIYISENLKSMISSIKHIARSIIGEGNERVEEKLT